MTLEASALSVERSVEFFSDPASYAPLTLLQGTVIMGCKDPRFPDYPSGLDATAAGPYPVTVQTGGGEAGMVLDTEVMHRAVHGEPLGFAAAQDAVHSAHPNMLGSHRKCGLAAGLMAVLAEAAKPSDLTTAAVNRMRREVAGIGWEWVLPAQTAMIQLYDSLAEGTTLHAVVERADTYNNGFVYDVKGENAAGVHVTNYSAYMGIDRNKMPTGGVPVQGYHDSFGAYVAELTMARLSKDERIALGAAALLRSAAARTVLMRDQPNGKYLEVRNLPAAPRLNIVEVDTH